MDMEMPMLPGLGDEVPSSTPYVPGFGMDPESVPEATFREVRRLADGDTLSLRAGLVRRSIAGQNFVMLGYNGQYPGPLLRVAQGSTIVVEFQNEIGLPSTVHWHGVRLENRFDGVPDVTQDPVESGEAFVYHVHFPDAGIYWYHPHVDESFQQDAGLYGNMIVDSPHEDYYGPANREEILMLDDLLIDGVGLLPWGLEAPSHAFMGRFGNVFLINGQPDHQLEVTAGEVVRYFFTNVSNTRTFNLLFHGAAMKVVAADISRFERERMIDNLVIGPAQRYVVDVLFAEAGTVAMTNTIQAINHVMGTFYPQEDTLGTVAVRQGNPEVSFADEFALLREHTEVQEEIAGYRDEFSRPPDKELELTLEVTGLHSSIMRSLALDTLYSPPVEWNDAMPMMNWLATANEIRWILRDGETGLENMEIGWRFQVGDIVKLRISNDPGSVHPMQHPIHVHGQRFLVLETDGVAMADLAWKDTVIIPVGSTVDLLVEMSNPGDWMLHCHIAEHLDSEMMMTFHVEGGE